MSVVVRRGKIDLDQEIIDKGCAQKKEDDLLIVSDTTKNTLGMSLKRDAYNVSKNIFVGKNYLK